MVNHNSCPPKYYLAGGSRHLVLLFSIHTYKHTFIYTLQYLNTHNNAYPREYSFEPFYLITATSSKSSLSTTQPSYFKKPTRPSWLRSSTPENFPPFPSQHLILHPTRTTWIIPQILFPSTYRKSHTSQSHHTPSQRPSTPKSNKYPSTL